MKPTPRGLALGTVLACMAALSVVLFAAVSASLSHLNFSRAASEQEHAQNLADAAISEAIDRLVASDYAFGADGTGEVSITINGLPDAEGRLSFSGSGPFRGRQSTNQLDSDDQTTGGLGRAVPGRTVHLLARGRVGGTERWVECLYHRPPFPDGLIASGPIDAKALHLVGIRQEGDYPGGDPDTIPPEDRLPGNLFSNATSGFGGSGDSASVSLNSNITGSVGAVGPVGVDGTTLVGGELLPGSDSRVVPNLNISQKIALLESNAITLGNSYASDLVLDPDWFSLSDSGLTVARDLDLQGSALLVRGDLTVGGAVTGTGMILVEGDVTIGDGGTNIVGGDQVAIGCTGDFDLHAAAPENNYFKGLVYCEGDFLARDITVVGATVVNGKNGAQGSARLENVRFVYNPGSVELVMQPPTGIEVGDHTLAVGFTLKPSGTPGEYLCDARAYLGFSRRAGDPVNIDTPLNWPPLDRLNSAIPRVPNPNNPNNWYEAFENVPLGNPNSPGFGAELSRRVGTWADDIERRLGGRTRPDWATATPPFLISLLQQAINEQDVSRRLSFNLNNLMAESLGSSRVLYWRPLK